MPPGVFGMLFGDNVGASLVTHPAIKAVVFTGSPKGGRVLFNLAANRPDPIPVSAGMSSINPVILMPGALAERSDAIAAGLADSITLGSGQFCTNPGLVIGFQGTTFDAFCQKLANEIKNRPAAVMLNRPTLKNYLYGLNRHRQLTGVELLTCGAAENGRAEACLFRADASLLSDPAHPLEEELFGPATVVVAVQDMPELIKLLPGMRGHLSTSLFANENDLADADAHQLIETFETRTGRLILNDFPTGVEVCEAMIHGGPWPVTSDSRSTSVGTLAIDRFLSPLCYQGYPDSMLPPALQGNNPLGVRRFVDGEWC